MLRSSLGDGELFFASFPSTSYWATFTESLRNKSPHHTILALKLTRMGSRRKKPGSRSLPKNGEPVLTDFCIHHAIRANLSKWRELLFDRDLGSFTVTIGFTKPKY